MKSISKAINPNPCSQMFFREKPQYNMTHLMPNSKSHHCHSYSCKYLFCWSEIKSSWPFEFSAPKFETTYTSLDEQKPTLLFGCHWKQDFRHSMCWKPSVPLRDNANTPTAVHNGCVNSYSSPEAFSWPKMSVLNKLKQTPASSKI